MKFTLFFWAKSRKRSFFSKVAGCSECSGYAACITRTVVIIRLFGVPIIRFVPVVRSLGELVGVMRVVPIIPARTEFLKSPF